MKLLTLPMLAAATIAATVGIPTAHADLVSFITPSGNVACLTDMTWVRCDISERDWTPPPRPADCNHQTGYGQGIELQETGRAEFVCAGDTVFSSDAYVLDYGEVHSLPNYSCRSEQSGLTCTNDDGHGFTLSRQAYRLF